MLLSKQEGGNEKKSKKGGGKKWDNFRKIKGGNYVSKCEN